MKSVKRPSSSLLREFIVVCDVVLLLCLHIDNRSDLYSVLPHSVVLQLVRDDFRSLTTSMYLTQIK